MTPISPQRCAVAARSWSVFANDVVSMIFVFALLSRTPQFCQFSTASDVVNVMSRGWGIPTDGTDERRKGFVAAHLPTPMNLLLYLPTSATIEYLRLHALRFFRLHRAVLEQETLRDQLL
jgi:hypothetical protein